MYSERFFYLAAAGVNLLVMLIGFSAYYLHGQGEGGRFILPVMVRIDFLHGVSLTAWFVLFLVQALLVSAHRRRLHMKLGLVSVVMVPLVAITSLVTAVSSVRATPQMVVFHMPYPQFLLVMLMQVAVFLVFATAGLLLRKRPSVHRVLMLMASLSLLLGATSRIPWLNDMFGGYTPSGYFGPIFAWGALLPILGSLRIKTFDRRLAAGYSLFVACFLVATIVAPTDSWGHWVGVLMK